VWSSTDRPQWRFFFMIPYQYENMDWYRMIVE
jgi:hypothetical protein